MEMDKLISNQVDKIMGEKIMILINDNPDKPWNWDKISRDR